jgi:hypothetical protein
MSTIDVGDFAVRDDWALACNMPDIAVDRAIEYHPCAGGMEASTVIVLVVGLLVVGHVDRLSGIHR